MKLNYLQTPAFPWSTKLPKSKEYPRHWITTVDLEITLSDGYILKRPKGTVWDGASIPTWLWWLMKPIDEGAIGDFIHDMLWTDKQKQFEHFDYNIYKSRKFADDERVKWRDELAPKRHLKTKVTHLIIRAIGGLFYSRQIQIPK